MDLSHSDVQSILRIIDSAEHLDEIELVYGGFRLHVVRNGAGSSRPSRIVPEAPVITASPVPDAPRQPAASAAQLAVPEGMVAIRAPMLGMFYRAAAPGEKPFIEEGQRVRADDTVCLIEVMKLFNSLRAGVDGKVAKILVSNGGFVEYNQPLILIAPDRKD